MEGILDNIDLFRFVSPSTNRELQEIDKENSFNPFHLSFSSRFIIFLMCIVGSLFFFVLTIISLAVLLVKPKTFAFYFTLFNLFWIGGLTFFIGPKAQFKMMFSKTRVIPSILYLGSMVLLFLSIFYFRGYFLSIVILVFEFATFIWYILSYIPFGRSLAKKVISVLV